jgi:hypothetical protein
LTTVTLAVAAVIGWNLAGGHLLVMETPSMCPKVCVGSLVAIRPVQGPLRVGELINFHPPGSYATTYTHQISHIYANGMIETRGVANAAHDPWLITRSQIVGRAVFTVSGLGWLLKAMPLLAVGVLFWVLGRKWVTSRTRRSWDRAWITALAVLPIRELHPLVRAAVISSASDPTRANWVRDTVANTGLFPISVQAVGGATAHVAATGISHVVGPSTARGVMLLHETASFHWWGWAIIGVAIVSPLVGYLWHVSRGDESVPDPALCGGGDLAY